MPAPAAVIHSAQGKDFSSYQGPVTRTDLAGLSFAGARISNWGGLYGTTQGLDPNFRHNWQAFHDEGLDLRIAYWYLLPWVNPAVQARYAMDQLGAAGWQPGDMLACDSEELAGNADEATAAFGAEIDTLAGPRLINAVYSNHNVGQHLTSSAHRPLWFAWPSPAAPPASLIAPWPSWRIWQWGIRSVDMDAYNGTAADLRAWVASFQPPAGPQAWTADGNTSLAQLAAARNAEPSTILRLTCEHSPNAEFSAAVAAWLNGIFTGTVPPAAAVPAGAVLYAPAPATHP